MMVGASYTVVKQPLDVTTLDTVEILGVFIIAVVVIGIVKLVIDITFKE